ncbi:MAG: AAA family ATPase [Christensenellales bacterium]|nr:AAA family ATPase [Christensenellales bacterium]
MKHLYLIGGPMGVGKTAVSRSLHHLLPHSAFLDGDWCWDIHPFTVTPETKAMVMDNIAHLLRSFLLCSEIDHVIFCWVLHEQTILDDLLSRLPLEGVQVVSLSLLCDADTLTARLQRDIHAGLRTPDVIARSLARLDLYDVLHTYKLNTSSLTPDETAHAILALCPSMTNGE